MNTNSLVKINRALISVSNKDGIIPFAIALARNNIEIISTGKTFETLHAAGIKAKQISEVTGFPEILDGRVKTLHPAIHGGILARRSLPSHLQELDKYGIQPIDLVVTNLYPFEETIAKPNVNLEEAIEQIDIGGITLIRAAAKNYNDVVVVVDPSEYAILLDEIEHSNGSVTEATRKRLALAAFRHTSHYDTIIAQYLTDDKSELPDFFTITSQKNLILRYGENPHQNAALYGNYDETFHKIHGKELSYNNILDIEAATKLCAEFSEPAAVIVKHNNPCGVGTASNLIDAYRLALSTDTKSAFGGIVAFNRPVDEETAKALNELFTEVIIAPDFPITVLSMMTIKKDRRLIVQRKPIVPYLEIRSVTGGFLVQNSDSQLKNYFKTATKRAPTDKEIEALTFAWKVAKHVRSNAIVYSNSNRTLGIGAGQMSRVDSSRIAAIKAADAGLPLAGSAVASDAYFPFADGLLEAVKVGATAVIQPGGSIRDQEVIDAANEHNIAMVFTGIRHFRH